MFIKILCEILVPNNIKNKISVSFWTIVAIIACVIFNSNFLKHIKNGLLIRKWNWTMLNAVSLVAEMAVLRIPRVVLNFQLVRHIL